MYDIVFITNNSEPAELRFLELKTRFPTIKRATTLEEATKKTFTKLFWTVWYDQAVNPDFHFDYKVPEWDEQYVHVFKNGDTFDGICLIPKSAKVSDREFKHRFFINKKEINIVASAPVPYSIYNITTYEEYSNLLTESPTDLFWVVWQDVDVCNDFTFDYYVPYYDTFHRNITHVFKNGEFYDGICLFSKTKKVSKREFDHRFFSAKKEVDIVASTPKPFDIVFISYREESADKNFSILKERFPRTKRIHGVKGIHNAHIEAAKLSVTSMFWVVDADAVVEPSFKFEFQQVPYYDTYTKLMVHVWHSRNPVNGLVYGYGGVKLLPKHLTLDVDTSKPDMTTSISKYFSAEAEVSNITAFNTDPYSTWRSAFRECVKLSSSIIDRQDLDETLVRLNTWCTVGADQPYGEFAISGALAGRKYGQENAGNLPALALINDFDWLTEQFQLAHPPLEK